MNLDAVSNLQERVHFSDSQLGVMSRVWPGIRKHLCTRNTMYTHDNYDFFLYLDIIVN